MYKIKITEAIGNTPLFDLSVLLKNGNNVRLYGKGEFLNVSGSVKDRAAKAMLEDGLNTGKLTRDKIIIEATSGNTGIAYAMMGAALGIRVILCMPENVTRERKVIMRSYGAKLIETPALEGIEGAYAEAKRLVAEAPERYFYPDQYVNPQNWLAHYNTTANEIWRQTDGRVTHFVSGTGTSGTFMGCSRRLKELNPGIVCCNMTPDCVFHGIEGIKHVAAVEKKGFFDGSISDREITVTTEEAYAMTRRLASEVGLFAGISSGANVAAAVKLAEDIPDNSSVVTVLCDSGCRYISTVWDDKGGDGYG